MAKIKRVVIIDDEEDLCRLMKAYLEDIGYDVFLAHTLGHGLILMQEVSPDILFLDNNLPDGLGWERMKFLTEQFPDCKITLISAYKYFPPELRELKSAVRILEKPITLNALKDYL